MRNRAGAGCLALLLCMAAALPAQERRASPPLDARHWAYAALDRLDAAGLLDSPHVGERPLSESAVAAALDAAALRAVALRSPLAGFARAARLRFAEERRSAWPGSVLRVETAAGYSDVAGMPDAGRGEALALRGRLESGDFMAVYEPELYRIDGVFQLRQPRWLAGGRLGRVWGFVGRERFRYGPAAGGGIVLGELASHDALVLGLEDAVRLPGWGRHLGPFRATLLMTLIPEDTLMREGRAFFSTARISFSPHRRVLVGMNRSIMVVPEVQGEKLRAKDIAYMTFGGHTPFEDQIASVDLRLRMGIRGVPLLGYFELGAEDTGGAVYTDPGLAAGLLLPVLPLWPAATLRYEYAAFGEDAQYCWFCRFHFRRWYHHGIIRRRYMTDDGVSFGHPLGGYGHEHRLEARAWLQDARLRAGAVLLWRNRLGTNMLHSLRPGQSRGAEFDLVWRATSRVEAAARYCVERGEEGWRERSAWLGVSARF